MSLHTYRPLSGTLKLIRDRCDGSIVYLIREVSMFEEVDNFNKPCIGSKILGLQVFKIKYRSRVTLISAFDPYTFHFHFHIVSWTGVN